VIIVADSEVVGNALVAAVAVVRAALPEITVGRWALIGAITGGRLLLPDPSG
jgi:hypothetical protein